MTEVEGKEDNSSTIPTNKQEHENNRKRTTIAVVVLDLTDCVSRYH